MDPTDLSHVATPAATETTWTRCTLKPVPLVMLMMFPT